jgi:hypothetical protein
LISFLLFAHQSLGGIAIVYSAFNVVAPVHRAIMSSAPTGPTAANELLVSGSVTGLVVGTG